MIPTAWRWPGCRRSTDIPREAGNCDRRDRPGQGGWCALRLCAGRCRLRAERVVPPSAERARLTLGGWHPPATESLSCPREPDLSRCRSWPAAAALYPGQQIGCGRDHARRCDVAIAQLAPRHQGPPVGPLRGHAGAGCGRTAAAYRRHGRTAHARRGGLATIVRTHQHAAGKKGGLKLVRSDARVVE